jgi:hypothetical protein
MLRPVLFLVLKVGCSEWKLLMGQSFLQNVLLMVALPFNLANG